mmetsp:Transcript_89653/g.142672  ORF Transcript_89653/g.142672 Transcript_89653/m.142672 type:complete len:182 (-) Transcript_89653:443-988(-)
MGGGVSGGTRTQLAGTYLAEQTHYQPPKYTLISVSSALGPDGCPKHLPSSATAGGAPGATPRLRQGGPAPVTVIPALADMEPLLQDNERRDAKRTRNKLDPRRIWAQRQTLQVLVDTKLGIEKHQQRPLRGCAVGIVRGWPAGLMQSSTHTWPNEAMTLAWQSWPSWQSLRLPRLKKLLAP